MNLDQLREYVSEGREIEFKFNGKKYSIQPFIMPECILFHNIL